MSVRLSSVATFLSQPNSANLRNALTDETGTGVAVFATTPTLVTPVLGTPTSGLLTNCTGLPLTTGTSLSLSGAKMDGIFNRYTSTVTGSQNNLNATSGTAVNNVCIEWSGASDATITGIDLGSNATSESNLLFKNTGTKVAYFSHLSGSSDADNQFTNLVTSSTTAVAPGGWINYVHNGTNWIMVGHEQGDYITPGFSAGNFTLSGDRTWTVDSGDVTTLAWKLIGRSLHYIWKIATSTVSGGATSGFFKIAIPNSYSPTLNVLSMSTYILFGATEYVAYGNIAAAGTTVGIQSVPATADFGTSTNGVYVYGQTFFEVT